MASPSFGFLCSTMQTGMPLTTKHDVGPVALARGRLQGPFPGDVKRVGVRIAEIDQPNRAMALLVFIVPGVFPAQPGEHFPVAFDRRRNGLQRLDDRADGVGFQPRIEGSELQL